MELGVERIAEWMRSNRLRLNPEKTDFLWCATRRRCIHLDTGELSVCGALIRPSTSVRDLGVLLESDLSMRRHVAWTVGCCFRQIRLIRSCIKSLPLGVAKAAVADFVTYRVDRCNSLLAGAPACLLNGLQSVLNADARLICNRRKFYHITPLLRDVPTGCQSHSASSTSSVYSSFFHFTELLQSTCAIAAPGLIPPRPDYGYDHGRGLITVCGG